MNSELTVNQIRDELVNALGGIDQDFPLDSLQIVAVMSYLSNRGFEMSTTDIADRPSTIGGWVQWAGRHSSVS